MILFSSVNKQLQQRLLMRGICFASLGGLGLLLSGIFLPPEQMKHYGWIIWLVCMGLIAVGLIPYKKLKRIADRPNKISVDDTNTLTYFAADRLLFSLPIEMIEQVHYIERGSVYGVGIMLKKDEGDGQIKTHNGFDAKSYQESSRKKFTVDLFLPYFSQRSFLSLSGLIS